MKQHSLPIRAFFYILRIPERIFNRFIFYPSLDRKITKSDLQLFVHDKQRGLMRVINYGERLHWTLDSGKVCDAVPWLDRIEPLISSNDIVFDIGANIGVVTNWFAHRCQHVHAFEPHPDNFETIKSQQELRNMKNITLHDIALGKDNSKMQTNRVFLPVKYGLYITSDIGAYNSNHDEILCTLWQECKSQRAIVHSGRSRAHEPRVYSNQHISSSLRR